MRYALTIFGVLALSRLAIAAEPEFIDEECRQGHCTGYYVLDTRMVGQDALGKLVQVMTRRLSYSAFPGAKNDRKNPEVTNDTFYEFCSHIRPASIFKLPGSAKWIAHILAPGYREAVYGATYDSYVRYFRFCHGLRRADPNDSSLATKYGYSETLVVRTRQMELDSPENIMSR